MRPGRRVIVVTDLADLRGPASSRSRCRCGCTGVLQAACSTWTTRTSCDRCTRPCWGRRGASGGPDQPPGSRHADCCLAGPAPAQGRTAGLGRAPPGAARARRGVGRLMPLDELHRPGRGHRAAGRGQIRVRAGRRQRPDGARGPRAGRPKTWTCSPTTRTGVEAAAGAVEAALREAGFGAERLDESGGAGRHVPDLGQGLAEWIVVAPGGGR